MIVITTVYLSRNEDNYKFIAMNVILLETDKFSTEDILNKVIDETDTINTRAIVEGCLDTLLDNGLIYEIGNSYKVKNVQC